MKHYEFEISQFLDNELLADDQKNMFLHLSECEECSKSITDLMKIKKDVKSFYNDMDIELKDSAPLINTIVSAAKKRDHYKVMFYFTAAASILLGFFVILLEGNHSSLDSKYRQLQKESFRLQNECTTVLSEKHQIAETNKNNDDKMNLLRAKYEAERMQLLKTKIMKTTHKTIASSHIKRIPSGVMYGSIEKITKEDFLIPQMIGN